MKKTKVIRIILFLTIVQVFSLSAKEPRKLIDSINMIILNGTEIDVQISNEKINKDKELEKIEPLITSNLDNSATNELIAQVKGKTFYNIIDNYGHQYSILDFGEQDNIFFIRYGDWNQFFKLYNYTVISKDENFIIKGKCLNLNDKPTNNEMIISINLSVNPGKIIVNFNLDDRDLKTYKKHFDFKFSNRYPKMQVIWDFLIK